MKRKKGHDEGNPNKVMVISGQDEVASLNSGEFSGDEDDNDVENRSGSVSEPVDVGTGTESSVKVVRPPPMVVYGRCKVKLKKNLGAKPTVVGPSDGEGSVGEKVEEKKGGNVDLVRYNKQELEASLEVIKKIMRMDGAEPFNVPVNPVELGIPDYFDVIDTPMDFGTICKNLERGVKYMNSKDVFKDVQHIWNNCFKYNNKGDYIVDLMRRVKNNFMKYWLAAGLYTESTKKANGEGSPTDEAKSSGYNMKFKKGKGFKRHKDGCMCAVCIMLRRRKERQAQEAREAGFQVGSPQLEATMIDLTQEIKQENSQAESPRGEDTSSCMETSSDVNADTETERAEEMRHVSITPQHDDEQHAEDSRSEFNDRSRDISQKHQHSDKGEVGTYSHAEMKVQDVSVSKIKIDQPEGQTSIYLQQQNEQMELEKKQQRLRLIETFRDLENPMLSGLCTTLFPNNPLSVWNRPNSLARYRSTPTHRNHIHEAIASFMTPYKSPSSRSRKWVPPVSDLSV